MRKWVAAMAVWALACGGGEPGAGAESEPAGNRSETGTPAVTAGTGTVHEVRMLLTDDNKYVYRPASLTVKVGDTVRWLNVSGFPHNVAFYSDKIPDGAREFLDAVYQNDTAKLGPLSGRLMTQPNDTYEISFVGAPTGTYEYFCTPHEALGMIAALTVTQ
ncbi:MAG: hypothetical protein GTN62_14535 [Gemmatimonadales bacterium]|nr:hypothetical protein [Gemmatimonadales bacterium]NIN13302.1 hypothetical protein [Gemmatimonadales bacterium]NIN51305.1 hypothetical protein [Gemmatimonadales bacterium]NIP08769.1 hypothetical protein [Gemmatimonadales bacterium]NIQ99763.1 hypothetical protein [Gemmatimonadales bacterium]